ncbi:Uncharacterised protein [Mycolicibacterium fortuitum]|uniref:Uncharacterized protein n=1 Tax=Mycolicibacterium fortuitum TaxID=1766 RepID=A0A378WCE3_MYCFO|nr:Uncharacterised protein [Mycolicibacterium fortuitum]
MIANTKVPQTMDVLHDHTWSDRSRPVWDFAQVLRAADLMPLDEDEYWEEPHKWDREHQLWHATGRPHQPPFDGPISLEWNRFLHAATQCEASL